MYEVQARIHSGCCFANNGKKIKFYNMCSRCIRSFFKSERLSYFKKIDYVGVEKYQ